jgi:hypothetical protein
MTTSTDEQIVASLRNLTPGFGTEEEAADRIESLVDALAAVTAERDQARAYLDGAEGQLRIRSDEAYEQRMRATRAESLLDQARQMLADAPHGWACEFNFVPGLDRLPDDAECTCWKAGM